LYILGRQRGFTFIEISISISVLAVLAALAIPALGNIFSRNQTRTAAIFFQDNLRQARYEARSRTNDTVTFCAISNSTKSDIISCDTTQGYGFGWLWYYTDTDGNNVLLGKNYAASDGEVTVSPTINFLIEIQKNNVTLWNSDNLPRAEIPIPYPVGPDLTYPTITFNDSSNRNSVVVFDKTGRTSVLHK
jgi:prepilin-type N-terminal cleavage/methylation domain-containing protein